MNSHSRYIIPIYSIGSSEPVEYVAGVDYTHVPVELSDLVLRIINGEEID